MTRLQDAQDEFQPTSEVQQRIAQLTEAVEARDTFIAVAAHELRNPMMPIIGQIELLLSAIKAGQCSLELVDERLGKIQRSVQQYMKRAVVLLDISRLNSGRFRLEPVHCDLAALVRDIADRFGAAAHHSGVIIGVQAPASLLGVWDKLAVEQIIDNLISNAIKYGDRSPVNVCLEGVENTVVIRVSDKGKGVSREDRARIFERFERAVGRNDHRSGFGVGLWIVGQLVEAMGGEIVVDDAPGGGALFIVRLPGDRGGAL
jgi:two-component system OmpR family sensor kinase